MSTTIRDVRDEDLERILEINNAAVPNVNHLRPADLDHLRKIASYFRVAESDGQLASFLIAIRPGAGYASENFRWFESHYDNFVYIDRVVVDRQFRGLGIGRVFYADVQSHAEQIAPLLTCEVNLNPRNDVSLVFHGTSGFNEVAQQFTEGGAKHVSLLAKDLPAYQFVQEQYGNG